MFFYVHIFISTGDGIAEKLLLFKIKFAVIFNLLIMLFSIIIKDYKQIYKIEDKLVVKSRTLLLRLHL